MSSSSVIEHMKTSEIRDGDGLAQFYFDFQDQRSQRVTTFLQSVIVQLSDQKPSVPEEVKVLYDDNINNLKQPTVETLILTLSSLAKEFQRTYIIVDALDECSELERLLKAITEVVRQCDGNINILAASREDEGIGMALKPCLNDTLCVEGKGVEADLRRFVQNRVKGDPDLNMWSDNLKREIENYLVRGSHGM